MNARVAMIVMFVAFAAAVSAGDLAGANAAARDVPAADAALVARGAALIASSECARCHAGGGMPELAALPIGQSCTGCHAWVRDASRDPQESARQRARFPLWDRYEARVKDFVAVPDLAASGARLDPEWMARYLRAPYHVRPGLREEMIRTALTEDEALAVAARLAAQRPALAGLAVRAAAIPLSRRARDIRAGAALYDELHCDACHAVGSRAAKPGLASAPDLAHVAERMRAADIAAYIAAPDAFGVVTAMPSFDLTAEQAARLRDFLVASRAASARPAAPPSDLPLLVRQVEWSEVKDRVFGAVCIHCHMDEDANGGDGGPGNTGGLGFRGKGLSFETWDGVVRGALDDEDKRVSILEQGPHGEEPLLIAKLRARYDEVAAERAGAMAVRADGTRAMPLGLPALSREDFQLVRTWLSQGARGPDGRAAIEPRASPVLAAEHGPEFFGGFAATCAPAFVEDAPEDVATRKPAPLVPLASAATVCPIHRREAE